MDKLFSAVSLCRKAGKLCTGMDAVKERVLSGAAALALLTSDVSERSERAVRAACTEAGTPVAKLPCTMEELAQFTGKPYGILAVCDRGFAEMIRKQLPAEGAKPGSQ